MAILSTVTVNTGGRYPVPEGPTREGPTRGEEPRTLKDREANREANIKAYILLRETIGDNDFINLVANKFFTVSGKYGEYSIGINCKVKLHQNITIGPKIRPITWNLCIDSKDLPEADRILSLYLAITKDEDNFIKTANFRTVRTNDEYLRREDSRDEPECNGDQCESDTEPGRQ